jgi:hypothetical protein
MGYVLQVDALSYRAVAIFFVAGNRRKDLDELKKEGKI